MRATSVVPLSGSSRGKEALIPLLQDRHSEPRYLGCYDGQRFPLSSPAPRGAVLLAMVVFFLVHQRRFTAVRRREGLGQVWSNTPEMKLHNLRLS